jgi:hypothetical protein
MMTHTDFTPRQVPRLMMPWKNDDGPAQPRQAWPATTTPLAGSTPPAMPWRSGTSVRQPTDAGQDPA